MSRKTNQTDKEVKFSRLEFSYHAGFEQDWAKVLAGILMQQIKENMEQDGVLDD